MHGASDAYVLSESGKAPMLTPHPYLLAAREIELSSRPQHNCRFNRRGDGKRPRSSR